MKKAFTVVLAALLVLICNVAQIAIAEEDYSTEGWYEVYSIIPENHDYSYIYNKPSSTTGTNLGKVWDGSEVYVFYTTRGIGDRNLVWAYCEYEGIVGFIHFENLVYEVYDSCASYDYGCNEDTGWYEDDGEDLWDYCNHADDSEVYEYLQGCFDHVGDMTVVNCQNWVSLREQPDCSSTRLAKVPLGQVVDAFRYDSDWTLCRYGDCYGFILTDYLASRG